MNSGIYKIVNTANGKQYVGSAVSISKRFGEHRHYLRNGTHSNTRLQNAWNKYGEDAFEFRVVGKCPPERLIELEQEVMDHLKPEYNIRLIAKSNLGLKFSEEARRKISEANRKRTLSEEHKRKIGEAIRKRGPRSIETRQKISIAHMGLKPTEETRQKLIQAQKGNKNALGYHHTEEVKQKLSEIGMGNTNARKKK
jgi:group I intron endonuclease